MRRPAEILPPSAIYPADQIGLDGGVTLMPMLAHRRAKSLRATCWSLSMLAAHLSVRRIFVNSTVRKIVETVGVTLVVNSIGKSAERLEATD